MISMQSGSLETCRRRHIRGHMSRRGSAKRRPGAAVDEEDEDIAASYRWEQGGADSWEHVKEDRNFSRVVLHIPRGIRTPDRDLCPLCPLSSELLYPPSQKLNTKSQDPGSDPRSWDRFHSTFSFLGRTLPLVTCCCS